VGFISWPPPKVIYLVMAYPKSTKDSLTDAEKAELKKLTQQLKDEVRHEFFDELKASLEEAVEIKNGTKAPARVTRYELADVKALSAESRTWRKCWEPASIPSPSLGNRTP
jgi:hypothetical protein